MRKLPVLFLAAALVLVAVVAPVASAKRDAASSVVAANARTADGDIVATAVGAGSFTTLASLLQKAGLVSTLQGAGPFTVFAPTDAAFAKVPKATLDALAADPAKLKAVLLYHVVAGNVPASDVVKLTSAKTVNGANVSIKVEGGTVMVNGAKVVTPDVKATNGVIHVIDTVLLPPAAPQNIVKTAVAAGQFKTLASLLQKAGLVKTLQGGTWTVFAPTDAAFAALLQELGVTKAQLLANKPLLTAVLTYHVVPARVFRAEVPVGAPISTVNTGTFTIDSAMKITDGRSRSANIVATDTMTSNGVIHVIDKVILPAQ